MIKEPSPEVYQWAITKPRFLPFELCRERHDALMKAEVAVQDYAVSQGGSIVSMKSNVIHVRFPDDMNVNTREWVKQGFTNTWIAKRGSSAEAKLKELNSIVPTKASIYERLGIPSEIIGYEDDFPELKFVTWPYDNHVFSCLWLDGKRSFFLKIPDFSKRVEAINDKLDVPLFFNVDNFTLPEGMEYISEVRQMYYAAKARLQSIEGAATPLWAYGA